MAAGNEPAGPVGFIGLGNMGGHIAANLLAAGFPLRVYNRTPEKARPLIDRGAALAAAPHEVATPGGIVVSIVANDAALEAVATDDLARALGPGGVHVSMSTVLPTTTQRLAERHAKFGAALIAAPVFGRPEAAAARKLWICTSGDPAAIARARPLFDAVGQRVYDFGPAVGSANVVKLAGNFVIHANIELMAEAAALAENTGIPRADLLNFLAETMFNCPAWQNYTRRLITADFDQVGFALPLGLKDTNLALQTAAAAHTPLPLASLLRDRFLTAIAKGRAGLDAAALALAAADDAGLDWTK